MASYLTPTSGPCSRTSWECWRRARRRRSRRPSSLSWSMAACTHLDTISVAQLPESTEGCEDCLAMGGKWLHLRICLECGKVGCCDDSPNRHARAHAHSDDH